MYARTGKIEGRKQYFQIEETDNVRRISVDGFFPISGTSNRYCPAKRVQSEENDN